MVHATINRYPGFITLVEAEEVGDGNMRCIGRMAYVQWQFWKHVSPRPIPISKIAFIDAASMDEFEQRVPFPERATT